jgi:hypothetical protein
MLHAQRFGKLILNNGRKAKMEEIIRIILKYILQIKGVRIWNR